MHSEIRRPKIVLMHRLKKLSSLLEHDNKGRKECRRAAYPED